MTVKVSREIEGSERSAEVLELRNGCRCIVGFGTDVELVETIQTIAPGCYGMRVLYDGGCIVVDVGALRCMVRGWL